MKPEDFKRNFDHANDVAFSGKNDRVVLTTNDPSVGGRYRIPVSNVYSGFDWESGDIIISVDEEIFSEKPIKMAEISKFICEIEDKVWDKIRNTESDAECRKYLLRLLK